MQQSDVIELKVEMEPWAKPVPGRAPAAGDLRLVCIYDLNVAVDSVPELLCLRRGTSHDELWAAFVHFYADDDRAPDLASYATKLGRVARAPRGGTPEQAARRLLKHLVRARAGFGWPSAFHLGGLVDQATYREVVAEARSELDRNAALARERETPVIDVARCLGLQPEPSGRSPTLWRARCPGNRHHLQLSSEHDQFYCGYCRRKGDAAELEGFAAEQRGKSGKH